MTHIRTSLTHPLQIASVQAAPDQGRIGITFCPGKHDANAATGVWRRDLELDLDEIQRWGASLVLTLVEQKELEYLKVPTLGRAVQSRGIHWLHMPISDFSTPAQAFEESWQHEGARIRRLLRNGSDIVVHCKGGQGRAGMIAARLLVELGMRPAEAISSVRKARKGAIETSAQEDVVRRTKPIPLIAEVDMDWFQRLTGFRELDYVSTRAKFEVKEGRLISLVNGMAYSTGRLELASLSDLRDQVRSAHTGSGGFRVSLVSGDVRELHKRPEYAGALFQVASQFNLLEMTGPSVTPEAGVTIYQGDPTQGPACAIAAGAATIYRNYFAKVNGVEGQTKERQLDGLADLGIALSQALGQPVDALWEMRNGYALCSRAGLDDIAKYIRSLRPDQVDQLRGKLRIGLHHDVEVTDAMDMQPFPVVSQAFCSALPVRYSSVPSETWKEFALLVLEAAYEATMWAAVLRAQRGASNVVLLTSLGGKAFGNEEAWIIRALRRALKLASQFAVDVKIVSYGAPSNQIVALAKDFG